jgi:uncharacterized UBP type Zn finger protein
MDAPCPHLVASALRDDLPAYECPECVAVGDRWVHLRICLTCGHVGCCDSSKNRHATAHFRASGHPVVQPMEPGERWLWCYQDRAFAQAGV